MTFSTPQEEIAYLRQLLRDQWDLFAVVFLAGERIDEIQRQRGFIALDRKVRELGIVGKKA